MPAVLSAGVQAVLKPFFERGFLKDTVSHLFENQKKEMLSISSRFFRICHIQSVLRIIRPLVNICLIADILFLASPPIFECFVP